MACRIIRKKSHEAGKQHYYLATFDFSSLEARLASIDTVLNDEGLDQTLYELYKKGSKIADMHSMTGFGTFCKSVNMYIHEAVDDTGKVWKYIDKQPMLIERDGKQISVLGRDIKPDDKIISYVE